MEKCKVKIAILEENDLLYEGVTNSLLKGGGEYLFYRATQLRELTELLEEREIDVVVASLGLILNREELLLKLQKEYSDLLWLAFEGGTINRALERHFRETLYLSDSYQELSTKLQLVEAEEECDDKREELSERERDVLVELVDGLSNREISEKLNISIHTVISHRRNIVRKTGIKSLSGLAIYAITNKIVPFNGRL